MIETIYENKAYAYEERENIEYNVKRLNPSDCDKVKMAADEAKHSRSLFGNVSLKELISTCFLTLGVERDKNDIVAVVCVQLHPNVPSILPEVTEDWYKSLYAIDRKKLRSALWIRYIWHRREYERHFFMPAMRKLFAIFWGLETVAVTLPPPDDDQQLSWLLRHGHQIRARDNPNGQSIVIFKRSVCTDSYGIRRAVEEDNDDVVPLIERESARLTRTYGEFYAAELLTRSPNRKQIVAEHDTRTVGVLIMNETINYDVLDEHFELGPFKQLRKTSAAAPGEVDDHNNDKGETATGEEEPEVIRSGLFGSCDSEDRTTFDESLSSASSSSLPSWWSSDYDKDKGMSVTKIQYFRRLRKRSHGTERDFLKELIESYVGFAFEVKSPSEMALELLKKESRSTMTIGSATDGSPVRAEYKGIIDDFKDMRKLFQRFEAFVDGDAQCTPNRDEIKRQHSRTPPKRARGEPNAFVVEIATCDSMHVYAFRELLRGAFECYPELEYCAIASPPDTIHPDLRRFFVKVTPKSRSNFPHDLFVLHHASLKHDMCVTPFVRQDLIRIEPFVSSLVNHERLMSCLNESLSDDGPIKAYMLEYQYVVLGLMVLKPMDDTWEHLHQKFATYEYEDLRMLTHAADVGIVEYLLLSPVFLQHARLFFRNVFQLSNYKALVYMLNRHELNPATSKARSYCCLIDRMVPIRMNRSFRKPKTRNERLVESSGQFALFATTPRLLTVPIRHVDCRLVVLGGSNAALSLLDTLFENAASGTTRLLFTNVTLITSVPIEKQTDPLYASMFVETADTRSSKQQRAITFAIFCNVIYDRAVRIDRKNRYVKLLNGGTVYYERLVIACGQQFQLPRHVRPMYATNASECARPINVFAIDTLNDALAAVSWTCFWWQQIRKKYADFDGATVVYGNYLETYCCVNTLLQHGVRARDIKIVKPRRNTLPDVKHETNAFYDESIEAAVEDALATLGVEIYNNYELAEWHVANEQVAVVQFNSRHHCVRLRIVSMFCYATKCVDHDTYTMINRAGIVFDGAIVIDSRFLTNDPHVYACGTITKYPRRYYADDYKPSYYNQREVGRRLGEQIKAEHLRDVQGDEDDDDYAVYCRRHVDLKCARRNKRRAVDSLPEYTDPLIFWCTLPGNVNYLAIKKAGKPVPRIIQEECQKTHCKVCVTGDPSNLEKKSYVRLQIDDLNRVDFVVCLTLEDVELDNFLVLWDKHESLLNRLVERYNRDAIDDLYAYFKEPWSKALYFPPFADLLKETFKIVSSATIDHKNIVSLLCGRDEERFESRKDKFSDLIISFMQTSSYYKLVDVVTQFISFNQDQLDTYITGQLLSELLDGYMKSPFFNDNI